MNSYFRLALLFFGALLTSSCDLHSCGNELLAKSASPGGKHVAFVSTHSCGATTPIVTEIRLADDIEAKFDPSQEPLAVIDGDTGVSVRWEGQSKLVVTRPAVHVYKQQRAWNDISIIYAVRK